MNKFHKTVASILAMIMLLTSANFAVFADEVEDIVIDDVIVEDIVIDDVDLDLDLI